MLANELRQAYIEFFRQRGHLQLPSAPLVPIDALGAEDTSTLFTSAGMQQFKPFFTGDAAPPCPRIVTVQKCVRTGDIESVGDYSHCTLFEMLGNFSFGDYFKAEVIPWTWEFLTGRLGLDPARICVTVFLDDDEAFGIWHDVVGLPEDRIHRLGEDKNYWPANAISEGPNGPCGPCTEVFYRVAPPEEMTSDPALTPTERYKIDDAAGRWLEVWNNVFTQYNRSEDAHGKPVLTPLPGKNNDTGAGFERIVALLQGKESVFDTDLFRPIISRIEELSGRKYSGTMEREDYAFRVVAEHARTMVFCIADGILPSNEGRGYVLRRVMRRAVRFGRSALGFDAPFLHDIAPAVMNVMGSAYPEIVERRVHVLQTVRSEEERFRRTLDNGSARLSELMQAHEAPPRLLPGDDVFTLYDTYGFPLELTQEVAAEQGYSVDLAGFGRAMEDQRRRSQEASEMGKDVFGQLGAALAEIMRTAAPTEFVGYTEVVADAKILGIIRGSELVDFARAGDEVEIVLDRTPFYAESGGQVGDTGWMEAPAGDTTCALRVEVSDTRKSAGIFLHRAVIREGEATTGQMVRAAVDAARRRHTMRNHTATHLLHAALREVLGEHVHQKGSLVAPDRLRFDFTHTQPMSGDEIRRVEELVNARILDDEPVRVHTDVPIAEAKARGAMALFGEKYGSVVRVVEIPGFSVELCGGTHLAHTSQVGLLKIVSETGIAAGVRRIEAVTGAGAYRYVNERESMLSQVAQSLKSNPRDVLVAVERLQQQRSQLERQIQQLKAGSSAQGADTRVSDVAGILVVTGSLSDGDGDALASQADRLAREHGSVVVLLGSASGGQVRFAAKVTPDLVKRGLHAGNLVREVAKAAGGGGGGRPDFAQAGGRDAGKLSEALALVPDLVARQAAG